MLTCSLGSGQLEGLAFEWFKDNNRIVPSAKFRLKNDPDNLISLLRVIDLKPSDAGLYQCVARNNHGEDKITTKLNVKGESSFNYRIRIKPSFDADMLSLQYN